MTNISEGKWCQDIGFEQVVQPSPAFVGVLTRALAIFSVIMNNNFKSVTVFERKRKCQQEF